MEENYFDAVCMSQPQKLCVQTFKKIHNLIGYTYRIT